MEGLQQTLDNAVPDVVNQANLHKLKTKGVVICKGMLFGRVDSSQTGLRLQLRFADPMGKLEPCRCV